MDAKLCDSHDSYEQRIKRFLFKSGVSDSDLPQYLWTLLRFCSPRALVTIRWATAQSVLGRSFTGWINSGKQQPSRVKIKKKKNLLLLVWNELNELPADLKALALAFLLPSARDLAFSIGWTMERAWFAEDMSIFLTVTATITFTVSSVSYLLTHWRKPPERACRWPTWSLFRHYWRQTGKMHFKIK